MYDCYQRRPANCNFVSKKCLLNVSTCYLAFLFRAFVNFHCGNPFSASPYCSLLLESYCRCVSSSVVQWHSSHFLQTSLAQSDLTLHSSSTSLYSSICSSVRGTLAAVARFASCHTAVMQNQRPSAFSATVWPVGPGQTIRRDYGSMRQLQRLLSLAMTCLWAGWSSSCSWRLAQWSGLRPPSTNCSLP